MFTAVVYSFFSGQKLHRVKKWCYWCNQEPEIFSMTSMAHRASKICTTNDYAGAHDAYHLNSYAEAQDENHHHGRHWQLLSLPSSYVVNTSVNDIDADYQAQFLEPQTRMTTVT